MGQTTSRPYNIDFLRNRAIDLDAQFRNAIREDDRGVQKKTIREMGKLLDTIRDKYPQTILDEPSNQTVIQPYSNRQGDEFTGKDIFLSYTPVANTPEVLQDKAVYKSIRDTRNRMKNDFDKQQDTYQKRRFHVLRNNGTGQVQQSKVTKRRIQHHKPLNQTIRYGYRNTTRRYMRDYEGEYVNQKENKTRRNYPVIPAVASIVEQVVPGVSFFGWIRSFLFGATPLQAEPVARSQQARSQARSQAQPQQPPSQQARSQAQPPSITSEIMTATNGDRKASNYLLGLDDSEKRTFLARYLEIKQIGDEQARASARNAFLRSSTEQASSSATGRTIENAIHASAKEIYDVGIKKLTVLSKSGRRTLKKPTHKSRNLLKKHTLTELQKALQSAVENRVSPDVINGYITEITNLIAPVQSRRLNSIQEGPPDNQHSENGNSENGFNAMPRSITDIPNLRVRDYLLTIENKELQKAELARYYTILHLPPEEKDEAFAEFYKSITPQ
jgi:hypothetical protein